MTNLPIANGLRKSTYEDYLMLPEEPGYTVEILDGLMVKDPAPSVHHQRVARELARHLMAYFDRFDPNGEFFFAPIDVTLSSYTIEHGHHAVFLPLLTPC